MGIDPTLPTDPFAGQRPMMVPAPLAPQSSAPGVRPFDAADQPVALMQTLDPSQLRQNVKVPGPRFFAKDGAWRDVLGALGDVMAAAGGGQGTYLPTKIRQMEEMRAQQMWLARRKIEREEQLADRDYEARKPQYFSGAEDRVQFDPTTGQTNTVYDAPTPAENYAARFGQPDSDEYRQAMQDYTLRGWGSTAMGNKMALDDFRTENRTQVKGSPSYRDLHPRPTAPRAPTPNAVVAGILGKVTKGQRLTPGEQEIYQTYKNGRRGAGGSGSGSRTGADPYAGQTIVNPTTGQRMTRKNGQWVPAT
ncbi:hypothetical protein [Sphingomonas montanisoli]|uniref:Uncharacterized protein n=1 Tax=Sphingomonas montanisoli TaxID=2606412 RepID=A0A5D9C2S6_9SPHN|nr:hypothetical protein [Sphingomonas montanisoli]TZG25886.1 hypothetical protein FYJ91_12970 [Sphingomonas montanisoli]